MATGTGNVPAIVMPDHLSHSDRKPWWNDMSPDTMSKDDFAFLLTEVVRWRLRAHAAEAALANLQAVIDDGSTFPHTGK